MKAPYLRMRGVRRVDRVLPLGPERFSALPRRRGVYIAPSLRKLLCRVRQARVC